MYWVICKCLAGVLLLAATLKLLDGQVPVSFVHLLGPEAATAAHLLAFNGSSCSASPSCSEFANRSFTA